MKTIKCDGSGVIKIRPDLSEELERGLNDSGLFLKEGVYFEVTELCSGCPACKGVDDE